VYVGWAQINRSALIRIRTIPRDGTSRCAPSCAAPDPSANPYLALTVMLAAALDGRRPATGLPPPLNNVNVYHLTKEERGELNIAELPGSLSEALRRWTWILC